MDDGTRRTDSGFTLIELLVVMIIIGILASIALPIFANQRKKAVDAASKTDLRTVATAIEGSRTDQERYPFASEVSQVDRTVTIISESLLVSSGSQVQVFTDSTGSRFCVGVSNAKGSADSATRAYWYASQAGGIQPGVPGPKPSVCP